MVGLENSVKGTIFYIDKDGEYQEIGTIESTLLEAEENSKEWEKLEDLYKETEFTAIFAIIAGNEESSINRNNLGLIMVQAINSMINKKERR